MKSSEIITYLGYAALIIIVIYFVTGILKISGEGLAKLGYPNNFIREGFSEKAEEVFQKKIDKILKQREALRKWMKLRVNR